MYIVNVLIFTPGPLPSLAPRAIHICDGLFFHFLSQHLAHCEHHNLVSFQCILLELLCMAELLQLYFSSFEAAISSFK